MKAIQGTIVLILAMLIKIPGNAQQYDNMYRAADADIIRTQGDSSIEHVVKGATIILPNSSNQLHVTLRIPSGVLDNGNPDSERLPSPYQFDLKLSVDPSQIQEFLTSEKTFVTMGFLTLNNVTHPVRVSYLPAIAETEEDGDFNIYVNVLFNAADFGIREAGSNTQFMLKIVKGMVNRV